MTDKRQSEVDELVRAARHAMNQLVTVHDMLSNDILWTVEDARLKDCSLKHAQELAAALKPFQPEEGR